MIASSRWCARTGVPVLSLLACGALLPSMARAQAIQSYFPAGNGGYDQELGVTVQSRSRPLYDPLGVKVGSVIIRPEITQGLDYNSNVNGVSGSGSWTSSTSGSVSAGSDWVRNRLDATVGFNHTQFFSFPTESYTAWNAGIAGGYTFGQDALEAAYSHQTSYSLGTTLGTIQTEMPTLNQTDSATVGYTFTHLALSVIPSVSASAYRFGSSTNLGQSFSEAFLDRNVVAAGVEARYALSDEGAALALLRGVNSTFVNPQAGQPSNNSNSVQFLLGLDYQAKGPWRYRVLVGVENRMFQASEFPARTAPIVEGSVIWSPTGLTTVTGTVSREIEDPESAGSNGFVATQASLSVDHEVLPNVVLNVRGNVESVAYLQNGGGQQTQFTAGVGAFWSLNRNIRLSIGYDYTEQMGSNNASTPGVPSTQTTGAFRQSVAGVALHLAL